jgi:superfamily II DNA or RNA helicase
MRVEVVADSALRIRGAPVGLVDRLRSKLTFRNPASSKRDRLGLDVRWVSDRLCFLSEEPGEIEIPRGALSILRECAKRSGVELAFRSEVIARSSGRVPIADLGISLRPEYQPACVAAMVDGVQGVVRMPCGAGKTATAAAAAVHTGEATLVIVHTDDILNQWVRAFEVVGQRRARVVGAGSRDDLSPLRPGEVAVCMVQTLGGILDEAGELLASAGVLIVDEAHRAPCASFARVIARCPARYRWALTATPDRPDGLGFMLDLLFGPVLYSISARSLIRWGYLRLPLVVPVDDGFEPSDRAYSWRRACPECSGVLSFAHGGKGSTGPLRCPRVACAGELAEAERDRMVWHVAVEELASHRERIETVLTLARASSRAKRTALVLLPRVKAGVAVARTLSTEGISAASIDGGTARGTRRRRLDDVSSGRVSVLCAANLADEGLDLPSLDCGIFAGTGRDAGRARQRLGRLVRPGGADRPILFDLVSRGSVFRGHWRERRDGYISEYGGAALHSPSPVSLAEALRLLSPGLPFGSRVPD